MTSTADTKRRTARLFARSDSCWERAMTVLLTTNAGRRAYAWMARQWHDEQTQSESWFHGRPRLSTPLSLLSARRLAAAARPTCDGVDMLLAAVDGTLSPTQRDQIHVYRRMGHVYLHQIIESNTGLVHYFLSRHFTTITASREDLQQAALLGLTRAAQRFDCRRGAGFATCAQNWILTKARREQDALRFSVSISGRDHADHRRLRAFISKHQLYDFTDEALTMIATALSLSRDKIRDLLSLDQHTQAWTPLIEQVRPDRSADSTPADRYVASEERAHVDLLLDTLDPETRCVVCWHLGLANCTPQRFVAIGQRLHISGEQARKIFKRGIAQLQRDGVAEALFGETYTAA